MYPMWTERQTRIEPISASTKSIRPSTHQSDRPVVSRNLETSSWGATMRHYLICSFSVVLFSLAGCVANSTFDGGGQGGGNFSSSCFSHAECGTQLVCVANACQSAFPRTYVFTFRSATIAKYTAGGGNWDFGGGAPDPKMALEVDGEIVCQTSTVQDTFDPTWSESCEVELFQTSQVVFAAWDMDISEHDLIGGIDAGTPLKDWILKNGGISGPTTNSLIERLRVDVSLK